MSKTIKKYERRSQHDNNLKYQLDQVSNDLEKLRSVFKQQNQDIELRVAKLVKQQQAEVQQLQNHFQREQIKLRQEQHELKEQIHQNEEIIQKLYQSLDDVNSIVSQKDKQIQNLIEDVEQERQLDQQRLSEM